MPASPRDQNCPMRDSSHPSHPGYADVVDLDRYPVSEPASPACRRLVQACQEQLRGQGVAWLAGFLTPGAVRDMLALAG